MLKSQEILNEIEQMKVELKSLQVENKIDAAMEKVTQIKNKQKTYELQKEVENMERNPIEDNNRQPIETPEIIDSCEVFAKALRREKLTDVENALVTGGSQGENNIIPADVNTTITELRRSYKSAKELVDHYPTTVLSGSFVYEETATGTALTNFTDGTNVPDSDDPKFITKSYAIQEYGGILPVSNVLLQTEAGKLVNYLGNWFNKKAILTENKKVFEVLKSNKTAKAVADWKALKKSINKDIDPSLLLGTVIVTNQDGFDVLDSALDGTGRPILQPNPSDPTKKLFMGYPVEVFSNTLLPTTGSTTKKAPIIYGNLKEGAVFVEKKGLEFASSEHAGFVKNQSIIRVIEFFDVLQKDKDAYVYGEIDVTSAV